MRACRTMPRCAAMVVWIALCSIETPLLAQNDVRVAVDEVGDDRYSAGPYLGTFELKVKLSGDGVDGVRGVRFQVKDARDDLGNSIVPEEPASKDFENPENSNSLKIVLKNPARKASSVSVSGTLELFAPKRDPNAVVTIESALKQLDKPLSSKGLKTSKVEVSVLSRERWAEELKKQQPDEKDLAELRAEAKKKGVSDQEIEAGIALLTSLSDAFGSVPENGVILFGPRTGMELIESVQILGPDGEENNVSGQTTQGGRETLTIILEPVNKVEENTSLRFTLLTDKARFTVPFALKDIPLP